MFVYNTKNTGNDYPLIFYFSFFDNGDWISRLIQIIKVNEWMHLVNRKTIKLIVYFIRFPCY